MTHHELPLNADGTLDRQQFLNLAGRLVIEQGAPSINSDGQCRYRGPNGLRCALGFFIPDDQVDELDGPTQIAKMLGLNNTGDRDLLSHVQSSHDEAGEAHYRGDGAFVDLFRDQMKHLTEMYGLRFEPGV